MTTGCDSGGQMFKIIGGVSCIGFGSWCMNLILVLAGVALLAWMAFGD